ncbi:ASCH domain-containing protein [Lysinibacillus fusiformis]|uniref:ASCH domain-containing protein n=1 Tax=Lysinibacillus fusiformis TaxID=28031 RepID=UPI001967A779|nr:ASCH domain-containing protein [Lysinibacillus fusiformis]QSB09687.1 ASCH domain-containing protein [Lysinibacillus fusiformis]
MKAITIKQPWATLIALGEKRFETRSWQTKYRGPIAIHAGKTMDMEYCEYPPIKRALQRHGIENEDLPLGFVIATAELIDCHLIPNELSAAGIDIGKILKGDELYFGDFMDGRYAWELNKVKVLSEPEPAKGKLSLWEWKEEMG